MLMLKLLSIGYSRSQWGIEHPLIFPGNARFDTPRLKGFGEDIEGVGFDFQVGCRGGRHGLPESGVHGFCRGGENAVSFKIKGEMKMDTPELISGLVRERGGQSHGKIGKRSEERGTRSGERGMGSGEYVYPFHLVQIYGICKVQETLAGGFGGSDFERGAKLNF